jgi:hypothetical protein
MAKNYMVYCISPVLIKIKIYAKLYPMKLLCFEELPFHAQSTGKQF